MADRYGEVTKVTKITKVAKKGLRLVNFVAFVPFVIAGRLAIGLDNVAAGG